MLKSRRMAIIAVFTALSLAMFMLESLLPIPFIIPGAKLGLANIITVVSLYLLNDESDVLLIVLARTSLASTFGGGSAALIYSLSGGLLSLAVMYGVKRTQFFSVFGVSVAGGFFHNLGQIVAAVWVTKTMSLWHYFPLLALCGIMTGLLIGKISFEILLRLQKNAASIPFISR